MKINSINNKQKKKETSKSYILYNTYQFSDTHLSPSLSLSPFVSLSPYHQYSRLSSYQSFPNILLCLYLQTTRLRPFFLSSSRLRFTYTRFGLFYPVTNTLDIVRVRMDDKRTKNEEWCKEGREVYIYTRFTL